MILSGSTQAGSDPELMVKLLGGRDAIEAGVTREQMEWVVKQKSPTLKVWDAVNGRELSSVPFETDSAGPGWQCVFSPDARLVLVALPGTNVLQLWDVWRKVVVASLTGHSQTVACCRFSPDGRRVLSRAAGGELKLWDPATGKEVLALNGHTARVCRLRVLSGRTAGRVPFPGPDAQAMVRRERRPVGRVLGER